MELRKAKGMTREQADELVVNPLYLACLMIKSGDADGEVAGAHNTTGNVLRPALQLIKTRPGLKVVSAHSSSSLRSRSMARTASSSLQTAPSRPILTATSLLRSLSLLPIRLVALATWSHALPS